MFTKNESQSLNSTISLAGKKLITVTLEMKRDDAQFENFRRKTAKEQIDHIKKNIKIIADEIKTKEPNADWVYVTWRENGLTGGIDSKSIDSEEKKYMKAKFGELTKANPKLIIATGGILVRKEVPFAKLEEIEAIYESHKDLPHKEKLIDSNSSEFLEHKNQLLRIKVKAPEKFTKYTTTTYVFFGDKTERHAKVPPYQENQVFKLNQSQIEKFTDPKLEHAVFQPGRVSKDKRSTANPIISLMGAFSVSEEICREAALNLTHEFKPLTNGPVDLLSINSDSVPLNVNSKSVKETEFAVLHVDSLLPTLIIETPEARKKQKENIIADISLYQYNIFDSTPALIKMVSKASCPLQYRLQEFVEKNQQTYASNPQIRVLLSNLKNDRVDQLPPTFTFITGQLMKFIECLALDLKLQAKDKIAVHLIKSIIEIIFEFTEENIGKQTVDLLRGVLPYKEKYNRFSFIQPEVKLSVNDALNVKHLNLKEEEEVYTQEQLDENLYLAASDDCYEEVKKWLDLGGNPGAPINPEFPHTAVELAQCFDRDYFTRSTNNPAHR